MVGIKPALRPYRTHDFERETKIEAQPLTGSESDIKVRNRGQPNLTIFPLFHATMAARHDR